MALAAAVGAAGCRRTESTVERTRASASVDRLGDKELMPGQQVVFGVLVPRHMTVVARFSDSVMLTGRISAEAAANHFRELVDSEEPEVGAARTVFAHARPKGATEAEALRIEVIRDGQLTRVWIRKIPQRPPPEPGLTDAERWERAGRNPDGTLKDRLKQY